MGINKQAWVVAVAVTLIGMMVIAASPVFAQSYDPTEDIPRQTGLEKALTKLGRGLSNVMLGWAEIPVTWDEKLKQGKPLGYLLGVAPVLGTARAVMRTSTGVYEIVTFPFSDRNINYGAVLEPEYIF
ncbi:MAG: exosortase system-associated protein, TIGR04073 family [Nitrospiraceae bacterium]|nr:exosortase system-associated protein, TIGR04073 family [Nitrospiraceae bacterium]